MSHFSTSQLVDLITGSFDAILRQWQTHAPKDSHLWELTQNKTALEILQQDIINIGAYFSAADALSEQAEVFLMAEYITALRQHYQPQTPVKNQDLEVEAIGNWLINHPELATFQRDQIYAPLCYRIGQMATAQGICSADTLAVLRKALLDLAYHFTLRDGNITPQEDSRIKEFHGALN